MMHDVPQASLKAEVNAGQQYYPGIEEFFTGNNDWLIKLGYDSVDKFNGLVDTKYQHQLDSDATKINLGKYIISLPTAYEYVPKFFEHLEDYKEIYKNRADELYEKRQRLEAFEKKRAKELSDVTIDKPIRMRRVDDIRKKMERTADVLFHSVQASEIDPYPDIDYWVVPAEKLNSSFSEVVGRSRNPIIEKNDPRVSLRAIAKASGHLAKNKTNRQLSMLEMADEVLVVHSDTFTTSMLNTTSLTIGEYGVAASQRVAQTVVAISKELKSNQDDFIGLQQEFGETLVRSTDASSDEPVPMLSLYEGILSIGQSINALIQEKVPGFETADQIVEALVEKGTLLKFVRSFSRMGVIGPMNLAGYKIPGLVQLDNHDQGLRLSEDFLGIQALARSQHAARLNSRVVSSIINNDSPVFEKPETYLTLEGCPATRSSHDQDNGVNRNVTLELTQLFLSVYRKITTDKLKMPKNV